MTSSFAKDDFPMLAGLTYLNSSLSGPPSLRVTRAMTERIESWSKHGQAWNQSIDDIIAVRKDFANLVKAAGPDEIALVPSVSAGLIALASSLDLPLGNKKDAVVSALNFPANRVVWQRMAETGLLKTVKLIQAKNGIVPLETYEQAVSDDTAVVAVDYVSGYNGYIEGIRELSEIAHKHGALLIVDAYHAVGAMEVDVRKIAADALICGFGKWMCGPSGGACLYVRKELLDDSRKLDPHYIGWHGISGNIIERKQAGEDLFGTPFPTDQAHPASSAARFEWGTWSPVVVLGIREALEYVLDSDQPFRYSAIRQRKIEIAEGLEKLGLELLTPEENAKKSGGGIMAFKIKNEKEFARELSEQKCIVSANFRRVVASPHFFNTREDTEHLLDLTNGYLKHN